jgi:hypothetical protein
MALRRTATECCNSCDSAGDLPSGTLDGPTGYGAFFTELPSLTPRGRVCLWNVDFHGHVLEEQIGQKESSELCFLFSCRNIVQGRTS